MRTEHTKDGVLMTPETDEDGDWLGGLPHALLGDGKPFREQVLVVNGSDDFGEGDDEDTVSAEVEYWAGLAIQKLENELE